MSSSIEDYALIGDTRGAGLVSKAGSIDWLCVPRFDSGACFAALLGTPEHGRWLISPLEPVLRVTRRYQGDSFVLETELETASGVVALIDCMVFAPDCERVQVVRVVEDPRVQGTLAAVERELLVDGCFVLRYRTHPDLDGLPQGEGAFLACSFWLVSNYVMQGRHDAARELFERLLALRNDVGLLAEEYDPVSGRMLGNFPQAFSHLALVDAAQALSEHAHAPPEHRLAPEKSC